MKTIAWIGGILFALMSMNFITSGGSGIIAGIFLIIAALLCIPPTWEVIKNNLNKTDWPTRHILTTSIARCVCIVVLWAVGALLYGDHSPAKPTATEQKSIDSLASITKAENYRVDSLKNIQTELNDRKIKAFIYAKEFVKERLKAPATASFPWGYEEYVTAIDDNTFIVDSYVDSQNSFGAMLREKYKAKLIRISKEDYRLISLNFYE